MLLPALIRIFLIYQHPVLGYREPLRVLFSVLQTSFSVTTHHRKPSFMTGRPAERVVWGSLQRIPVEASHTPLRLAIDTVKFKTTKTLISPSSGVILRIASLIYPTLTHAFFVSQTPKEFMNQGSSWTIWKDFALFLNSILYFSFRNFKC